MHGTRYCMLWLEARDVGLLNEQQGSQPNLDKVPTRLPCLAHLRLPAVARPLLSTSLTALLHQSSIVHCTGDGSGGALQLRHRHR